MPTPPAFPEPQPRTRRSRAQQYATAGLVLAGAAVGVSMFAIAAATALVAGALAVVGLILVIKAIPRGRVDVPLGVLLAGVPATVLGAVALLVVLVRLLFM